MYLAEFLSSMYVLHCELWRSAASLMLTNVMGKDPSLRFLAPATYMKPSGRARLPDTAAAAAAAEEEEEEEEAEERKPITRGHVATAHLQFFQRKQTYVCTGCCPDL